MASAPSVNNADRLSFSSELTVVQEIENKTKNK